MSKGPRRTDPFSDDELREMLKMGDTTLAIMMRAHRVNGYTRGQVREILFGANR